MLIMTKPFLSLGRLIADPPNSSAGSIMARHAMARRPLQLLRLDPIGDLPAAARVRARQHGGGPRVERLRAACPVWRGLNGALPFRRAPSTWRRQSPFR